MPRPDYYSVLGLQKGASRQEIKRAWRRVALELHPDRNPDDPDAARRFALAAEAWKVLSNPEERERYDRLGPFYRPDGRPPTPDEVSEILSEAFGGLFRRARAEERGRDLRATLTVELEEVARPTRKLLRYARRVRCNACGGTGADPDGGRRTCDRCGGTGRTPGRRILRTACGTCEGRGWIRVRPCARCGGEGLRGREEQVRVRIPPGVATGQVLRLRGRGDQGRSGSAGDLLVVVDIARHPLFQRRGADLVCDLPLTFPEAALGAEVEVPTLEGVTRVRIPPGTAHGQLLKLEGRGLPGARGRGDLHLRVLLDLPEQLDPTQQAALRRLQELVGPLDHPRRRVYEAAIEERKA